MTPFQFQIEIRAVVDPGDIMGRLGFNTEVGMISSQLLLVPDLHMYLKCNDYIVRIWHHFSFNLRYELLLWIQVGDHIPAHDRLAHFIFVLFIHKISMEVISK